MAFGKADLIEKLVTLERQVAVKDSLLEQQSKEVVFLRGQVEKFQEQVSRLQDSIIAVSNPTAYRQLKDDEFAAMGDNDDMSSDMTDEQKKIMIEDTNTLKKYIEKSEGPLFETPDDMMDALGRMVGVPENSSIHENDES